MSVLFHWDDTTLSNTPNASNGQYNDIWGYTQEGKEYAIIGYTKGVKIFDVTNPEMAHEVAFIQGKDTNDYVIHRDFKNYQQYLYIVADEGESSLQIVDMSYLPDSVHVDYDSDQLFKRAHNVFVDSSSQKLYVVGNNIHKGISVYSLTNPTNPTLLGELILMEPAHDIFVTHDTAFINLGGHGMFMYDFSNPQNPEALGLIDNYPDLGYNHSGWLSEDGQIYVLADETSGTRLKLFNVSDPLNIELITLFGSDVDVLSLPHNPIIKDHYVYSSYYNDGVYIWDISSPEIPILKGFYDTSTIPHEDGTDGCWGVYPFLPSGNVLASDQQNGLFVLQFTDTTSTYAPVLKGSDKVKMMLSPNPLSTEKLRVESNYRITEMVIYDVSGKIMCRSTINKNNVWVDLFPLKKGIYFNKINTKEGQKTQKIIKN